MADFELLLARSPGDEVVQPVGRVCTRCGVTMRREVSAFVCTRCVEANFAAKDAQDAPTAEWLRQAIAWREADLADLRERLDAAEDFGLLHDRPCESSGRLLASTPIVRAADVHHGAPRPEPPANGPTPFCVWDSE